MGRHKLQTMNTIAFHQWQLNAQRYCDKILRPIVVPFICTQFWKLKMSQFFHGLHTHQIHQPLSMFAMLWIDVYDSVFQFTAIEEEWDNIPQATMNNPINSMRRRCVMLYEANGCDTRY
jgi:hypothetical protein